MRVNRGIVKDLMGAARLEARRPDCWDGCAFDVSAPQERVSTRVEWNPPTRTHPEGMLMIRRLLTAFAVIAAITLANSAAWSEPKDIRWGTGPVGSSGHKALVVLANLLNKEMPEYRISVLPLPGAVMTVKGYATGEYRRLLRLRRRARRNSRPIPAASRASSRT